MVYFWLVCSRLGPSHTSMDLLEEWSFLDGSSKENPCGKHLSWLLYGLFGREGIFVASRKNFQHWKFEGKL